MAASVATGRAATERQIRLRHTLDVIRETCDREVSREKDPVSFVHRFSNTLDREIVGLVASAMAFGNVTTIRAKMSEILWRIDGPPSAASESLPELQRRLKGFKHRVFIGDDVARLMAGARRLQRTHGSLGKAFALFLSRCDSFQNAVAELCEAIRLAGGLVNHKTRRGPAHILPDVRRGAGSKRLLLFLRWMIRPDDGIDLGEWDVSPSLLVCPVDTHIHKLSRNLGFTKRNDVSWTTAVEITEALRAFDPHDPIKYDFSLCHMGMLQRCPSRRDETRCNGCGVKPVCRHWEEKRSARKSREKALSSNKRKKRSTSATGL